MAAEFARRGGGAGAPSPERGGRECVPTRSVLDADSRQTGASKRFVELELKLDDTTLEVELNVTNRHERASLVRLAGVLGATSKNRVCAATHWTPHQAQAFLSVVDRHWPAHLAWSI